MPRLIKSMDNDPYQKLSEISMALQVLSRLAMPVFDENGDISLRIATKEEWYGSQSPTRATKLIPVEPSVRRDGSTPFVWVFTCPPPYNGVEIVCVPDAEEEVGIRCTASRPNQSRERDSFNVVFMDKETLAEWKEWKVELNTARSTE